MHIAAPALNDSSWYSDNWLLDCRLQQSTGLLGKLEDRIERIHSAAEAAAQRQKDQDTQIEEAKNHLKTNVDFRQPVGLCSMHIMFQTCCVCAEIANARDKVVAPK